MQGIGNKKRKINVENVGLFKDMLEKLNFKDL